MDQQGKSRKTKILPILTAVVRITLTFDFAGGFSTTVPTALLAIKNFKYLMSSSMIFGNDDPFAPTSGC